jgi:peptide/nickel transport system permease protein
MASTTADALAHGLATRPRRSFVARSWVFARRWPLLPIVVLTALFGLSLAAPLITDYNPIRPELGDRNAKPFWYSGADTSHILGADQHGRDLVARILYGGRISLVLLAIASVTGTVVGTALGLASGYFGGQIDEVAMRLTDVYYSIPFILLALVAAIVFEPSLTLMIALLALLAWPPFVRIVRGEVLSLKTRDYVLCARIAGASHTWIMVKHILPGVINSVIVVATLRVGQLILAEATLSFLGAGIPPPTPTWGSMLSEGRDYLNDAWWISFFPGVALFLVVMSLNFIGDWFRDRFDPRLRQL